MSNESITSPPRRRAGARPAWWVIAVLVLAGPMLIAACGSSGSTAASTPNASPAAAQATVNCKNVDSLRKSLESLSHTNVSPASAGTLTADLKNVQTQLAALKAQGGGQFSGMTGELTASLNQINKAAGELTTNPTAAIQHLTTALAGLKGKIPPIIKQLDTACPKPAA